MTRAPLWAGLLSVVVGCSMPSLTRDGQLVWTPGAPRGAAVLTANGVEFIDRAERPKPVVRTSPYEPFRPATGFLLPADGRWHRSSQPVAFGGEGLAVTARLSDALAPAWGGEIVLMLELAPAPAGAMDVQRLPASDRSTVGSVRVESGSVRAERRRVVLVLDALDEGASGAVGAALARLGGDDQLAIVDARGAQPLTPWLTRAHRSLIEGVLRRRAAARPAAEADLAGALALGRRWLPPEPGVTGLVAVAADEASLDGEPSVSAQVRALEQAGVQVSAAAGAGPALCRALPGAPAPSVQKLVLSVSSSPGPAHVLEATQGQVSALLDDDLVYLDDLAGERTEVLRLSVPPFVPGEEVRLALRLQGQGMAGNAIDLSHRLVLRYTDDVERLARERSGDVLGYASALVAVGRLDPALFASSAESPGGVRRLIDWQRAALDQRARGADDATAGQRAELLRSLAWALD